MKLCRDSRCSLEGTGVSGNFGGSHEGCQVPFRPSGRNMGLPLRRCSGQGPHLAKTLDPRGFSRVAAGFSSNDGDFRLPLVMAQGSPIFHSSCENFPFTFHFHALEKEMATHSSVLAWRIPGHFKTERGTTLETP